MYTFKANLLIDSKSASWRDISCVRPLVPVVTISFECLSQFSMVLSVTIMVTTGNGESQFRAKGGSITFLCSGTCLFFATSMLKLYIMSILTTRLSSPCLPIANHFYAPANKQLSELTA